MIYGDINTEKLNISVKIFKAGNQYRIGFDIEFRAIFRDVKKDSFFILSNGNMLIRYNESENEIHKYNFSDRGVIGFLHFTGYPARNVIN